MLPLLLLIPGALILWSFATRNAERRLQDGWRPSPSGARYPSQRGEYFPPTSPLLASRSSSAVVRVPVRPQKTIADYLRHLHEATMAARILDTMKAYAINGDIDTLMRSPPEVAQALAVLSAPLDIAFAQKDLNVLGVSPSLVESGVMDQSTFEAIKAIQTRFGQHVTGTIDPPTAVAIRYSVGCINAQDRASAGV